MPYLKTAQQLISSSSPVSYSCPYDPWQIMEAHLGFAAQKLGFKIGVPAFEKIEEDRMVDLLKEAGLPLSGKSRFMTEEQVCHTKILWLSALSTL